VVLVSKIMPPPPPFLIIITFCFYYLKYRVAIAIIDQLTCI
ncbi:MAG: hypothetical protein ACI90V_009162, partial [Bacillariaceae sp.]